MGTEVEPPYSHHPLKPTSWYKFILTPIVQTILHDLPENSITFLRGFSNTLNQKKDKSTIIHQVNEAL